MNKKFLLFLTACVNPQGMAFTVLQNPQIRLEQYLKSITYYLTKTDFDILLVENSGYDFLPHFKEYAKNKRIEILSFNGNGYNKALGKGYGEGLIIKYAFNHSSFINNHDYIVKITGRHIVTNIKQILGGVFFFHHFNKRTVSAALNLNEKVAYSEVFVASPEFYSLYFLKRLNEINDSRGIFFEHILYEAISESRLYGYMFIHVPFAVRQLGISGSTGVKLDSSQSVLQDLKSFAKCVLYICRQDHLISKLQQ